ncbi:MAG: transcriptional antiterminator Rof (Rho-off) [Oleispira sp.]|jgi:transcriptional antiterminator Rof (Rho-off)
MQKIFSCDFHDYIEMAYLYQCRDSELLNPAGVTGRTLTTLTSQSRQEDLVFQCDHGQQV